MMGRVSTVLLGALWVVVSCGDDSAAPVDAAADSALPDAPPVPCTMPEECDDSNPCTDNLCEGGFCSHPIYREDEPCNDGLACTGPDTCQEGVCTSGPTDCSFLADFCNVGACAEPDGCFAQPVADDTPCDDGLFCTVDEVCAGGACGGGTPRDCTGVEDACNGSMCDEASSACLAVPVGNGLPCSDGVFCTSGDTCVDGACQGGAPPSCNDLDACTTDSCDTVADACQNAPVPPIPGAEGPFGAASCANGVDDDCDLAIDLADTDCVECVTPADCDDGNVCTSDACNAGDCDNPPQAGSCEDGDFCTQNDTCAAGACVPGPARPCADGNGCTLDVCNETLNMCQNPTRTVDVASPVATSSDVAAPIQACLAAGTGARVVAWTQLRDLAGVPITGATVSIGGAAATESTAQPGTYYRVVTAAGAPMMESLQVVATACGNTVTLSTSIAVRHAPANATAGGTGGCSPAGGNLRVRVVGETGAPLAGAQVLVGAAQGTPFQQAPEGLFGGATSMAGNVATTDASGYAAFFDYGNVLDGPVLVTAGAANRAYVTVVDGEASDLVLPAPLLHPAPPATTLYDNGTATTAMSIGCGNVDAGLVLPKLDLTFFSALDLSRFFARSVCWNHGNGNIGSPAGSPIAMPGNLWVPSQSFAFLCAGGSLNAAPWSVELKTGTTENLEMIHVDMDPFAVQDVLAAGAGFAGLLPITNYRDIGFILNESVGAPMSGRSINANETFGNTFTVTYGVRPPETDVMGFTLGDYAGQNGTGPLFLIGHEVHEYTTGGSTVAIPNSDLNAAGAPMGIRRLGSVSALYLDPAAHPSVPQNRRAGVTTVLLRGGASPPFGPTGGTATVSEFLAIAGTSYTAPRAFRWENATANGHSPRYSRHDLVIQTDTYLPVLPCATENDVRDSDSVQWVVYKPFGLGCGAEECFDLPVLPGSFPRAGAGAQKKDGFEAVVGSGAACSGGGCAAGEACVDPDGGGAAPSQCMDGAGTAGDPYTVQRYLWRVRLFDLGLATGWDFDAFDFATHPATVTHESTNSQGMP